MVNKISKIFLELIFLLIALCIAILIISFAYNKTNVNSEYDSFQGRVEKKELVITSPSFAIIESLNVYEGKLVKQGDELGKLKILIEPKTTTSGTLINNDTYKISKGEIAVYAPSDSIVGKVFYAEKSSVRPELEIMMLYPLASSSIIINDKFRSFNAPTYTKLLIQKHDSNTNYQIDLLETFPIDSQKDGGRALQAAFTHSDDSKLFENGEEVTILATKKDKPKNLLLDLRYAIVSGYSKLISLFK